MNNLNKYNLFLKIFNLFSEFLEANSFYIYFTLNTNFNFPMNIIKKAKNKP